MDEHVTVPPDTVLHALVTHCVRVGGVQEFGVVSPSGMVAGSPAFDQLIARLGASIPDHACPYESVENNSNIEIRGNKYEKLRLIYLWPPTATICVLKESLEVQSSERQTRKYSGKPPKNSGP